MLIKRMDAIFMRMLFILILLLCLLYYLVFMPIFKKDIGYRFNYVMIIVLSIVLLPLGYSEFKWQQLENRGTEIVQQISGKPLGHLKCQRLTSALLDANVTVSGYVSYDKPNTAVLKYEYCQDLKKFFSDDEPTIESFIAYHVLLHESRHVEGYYNEADTECMAISSHLLYPDLIGKDPEYMKKLSNSYYFNYYPTIHKTYLRADRCLEPTKPLPKNEDDNL